MDPLSNQVFSHDAVKYVYQNPDVRNVYNEAVPVKPFKLEGPEKSEKAKKDTNKEKKNQAKSSKENLNT